MHSAYRPILLNYYNIIHRLGLSPSARRHFVSPCGDDSRPRAVRATTSRGWRGQRRLAGGEGGDDSRSTRGWRGHAGSAQARMAASNFPLSTWAVVDLVLIMSVNPGFGGQSFIESQVKKISELRRLCAEKVRMNNISSFFKSAFWEQWDMHFIVFPDMQGVNPWIEVDGGVGPSNAYKVPFSTLKH
ncbi:hypothetical protein BHE74_00036805 [Ensete ventricosum]|nr:hypothetical protein BHE74_00036805 [Ensete ventricosum]